MDQLIEYIQNLGHDVERLVNIGAGLLAAIIIAFLVIRMIRQIYASKWSDAAKTFGAIAAVVLIAYMGAAGIKALIHKIKPNNDILPGGGNVSSAHIKNMLATAKYTLLGKLS